MSSTVSGRDSNISPGPAPVEPTSPAGEIGLPTADLVELLSAEWGRLLKTEVSTGSDWFVLGGDSLRMVRLLTRLRKHLPGLRIGLLDLFSAPTLGAQADLLHRHLTGGGS